MAKLHMTTVYLGQDQREALARLARHLGTSQAALVRAAIDDFVVKQQQRAGRERTSRAAAR